MLEGAVAHGLLDVRGKSEKQIRDEFASLILSPGVERRFLFTIDHTAELKKLARRFEDTDRPWLAALLYATWVEHVLNELITVAISRKGEPDALATRIIRDVQLSAKLDWLLPLLGFRPIGQTHAERLRKLAEFRNQYAHYKWPHIDLDKGEPSSKAVSTFLIDCRPTLAFLARYASSQLLGVSRAKLRRAVAPADP